VPEKEQDVAVCPRVLGFHLRWPGTLGPEFPGDLCPCLCPVGRKLDAQ
jgi:hypothetical protein